MSIPISQFILPCPENLINVKSYPLFIIIVYINSFFLYWPTCKLSTAVTSDYILPVGTTLLVTWSEGLRYTVVGGCWDVLSVLHHCSTISKGLEK